VFFPTGLATESLNSQPRDRKRQVRQERHGGQE
jgi:hypothetical protein